MPIGIYKKTEEHKRNLSKAHMGKYRREKNGKWKGGFSNNGNGYLLFKIPEGCQFSSMKNKYGYIYLHRLMMAEYLQRPLRPEEVVHHKNEDITDNRIENLKLLKNKGEHNGLHLHSRHCRFVKL